MSEKPRVVETPDEDPRGNEDDDTEYDNTDDEGDNGDSPDLIYGEEFLSVRSLRDERVAVRVGRPPETTRPTIVDARYLRDALNEYLDGSEAAVKNDSSVSGTGDLDDEHESVAFPDTSVTVDVDADVSDARDAIEALQTDVDALTEELNEAAERAADIDLGAVDFGLPAPSPSDVQAEMSETDTDSQEMIPAEPLYELARMWAGIPASEPSSYRQGRKEAGEWLKEELDELTGETDE